MTLPVSGSISLADVLTEIRRVNPARALPISLGDTDVRALAGKPSGPISLADLYGKSSYTPMTVTATGGGRFGLTTGSSFTATVNPSVAISGGDPGYTVLWEMTSATDAGFVLGGASSQTCSVSHAIPAFGTYDGQATLVCHVTDSSGHPLDSNIVTASFHYEQDA